MDDLYANSLSSLMNFSVSSLIAGLIFSVVGFWLFKEARRRANLELVVISIVMMIYPMFTSGPWQDWGVGIGLCLLAKYRWE
ncbi:MAG: hypothetical protein ACXVCP_06130 [Bdellovibrio sp.]